jgi:hypothetical protein
MMCYYDQRRRKNIKNCILAKGIKRLYISPLWIVINRINIAKGENWFNILPAKNEPKEIVY